MADHIPLTLAFMDTRPDAAARVLEDMPAEDAAALFAQVPARVGAEVIRQMAAFSAARCLEILPPERGAGLLRELPFVDAVTFFRNLAPGVRGTIADALPANLARDLRIAVTYPVGTVGAVMDQTAVSVAATRTVDDVAKLVKRRRRKTTDHLFVVDDAGRFLGTVRAGDLLRADGKTPVADLMDGTVAALSNRATLASVLGNPQWNSYLALPVIGRTGNFLGALSRAALGAGLAELRRGHRTRTHDGADTLMGNLISAYLLACAGMLRTVAHIGDPAPGTIGEPE
jgi:magnesium transporter